MISKMPFESLAHFSHSEMALHLKTSGKVFTEAYTLPHLLAYIARFPLVKVDGKYNAKAMLAEVLSRGIPNFEDNRPCSPVKLKGILNYLATCPRGLLIPSTMTQSRGEGLRFNAATPLFISAFKQYRDVAYSEWDIPSLAFFTDDDCYAALSYEGTLPDFTSSELLEYRAIAQSKTPSAKDQSPRTLSQVYKAKHTGDPDFDSLPHLIQLQLLQTWFFQPTLRTSFGLYTPGTSQSIPEDLVDTGVFVPSKRNATIIEAPPAPEPMDTSLWGDILDVKSPAQLAIEAAKKARNEVH